MDQVIAVPAGRNKAEDGRQGPCLSRGKDEFLDHAASAAEHVADRDPVLAACDAQNQIGGACGENDDVFGQDARREAQPVDRAGRGVVDVVDDVLTVAARDEIGVPARLTHQKVVAAPAFQHIRAAPALKDVVAIQSEQVAARFQPGHGGA